MKSLIFILSVLILSCSDNKIQSVKVAALDKKIKSTKEGLCDIPNLDDQIVRTDTIIDYEKYNGHVIKYYDSKNRIRKVLIINLYESNMNNFFTSTKIYDTVGHILYEGESHGLNNWTGCSFKYDASGFLIDKNSCTSSDKEN